MLAREDTRQQSTIKKQFIPAEKIFGADDLEFDIAIVIIPPWLDLEKYRKEAEESYKSYLEIEFYQLGS